MQTVSARLEDRRARDLETANVLVAVAGAQVRGKVSDARAKGRTEVSKRRAHSVKGRTEVFEGGPEVKIADGFRPNLDINWRQSRELEKRASSKSEIEILNWASNNLCNLDDKRHDAVLSIG